MRAPDYARPLIGWRVWCVVETADGLRLGSVIHDELWPPGTGLVARCTAASVLSAPAPLSIPHAAPAAECTCGIHAAPRLESVRSYLRGRDEPRTLGRVAGRVQLWGAVVEHEDGWRAERAYPLELWLPPELDGGLDDYGVAMKTVRRRSARRHAGAAHP